MAATADLAAGAPPGAFYAAALEGARLHAVLDDGRAVPLPTARWLGELGEADRAVLAQAVGPVLDVGCGPGRHVAHLTAHGVLALGIDASRPAVRSARERGAAVVWSDVFGTVPAAGSWHTALVLDGNIGIGGDPVRLLRRVRELVAPGGRILLELEPPGTPTGPLEVRLRCGDAVSAPLPWATVGADRVSRIASQTALRVMDLFCSERRWFAMLRR